MEEKDVEKVRAKQRELEQQIIQVQNQISQIAEKMEYIGKMSQELGNLLEKPETTDNKGIGRLQCPACSSTQIRELEDKDNIISFIPKPIYGVKYHCIKCGNEWK